MFETIGNATKLLRSILKLKDKAEIFDAIIPLQEMINDAQADATKALSQIHSLTEENIDLKKRLAIVSSRADERAKFEVYSSPTGAIALKLKPEYNGTDYDLVCANCMEKGEKAPLDVHGNVWICQNCERRSQHTRNKKPQVILS